MKSLERFFEESECDTSTLIEKKPIFFLFLYEQDKQFLKLIFITKMSKLIWHTLYCTSLSEVYEMSKETPSFRVQDVELMFH